LSGSGFKGRCIIDESLSPKGSSLSEPDANAVYSLGRNLAESARLRQQADELAVDSSALLDRVDLRPGQSAIDVGCGPRGVLDLLWERVAPGGQVVGLDADPTHTAMATEFAAERGLSGVEIVTADARRTGLPAGSFDVVHARTLLINVPDPDQVVAEMVRLAKPGGWVASMEPDTEHVLCYPPHPAYGRLCEIFPVVFARNGADNRIGRRVSALLRESGVEVVGLEARPQLYPPGHSRRTVKIDLLRSMRPHIVELGLATESELEEWDAAARAHLEDPKTVSMTGLFFLTWARKPT
jgi:SAM-dependent methyltransferase